VQYYTKNTEKQSIAYIKRGASETKFRAASPKSLPN